MFYPLKFIPVYKDYIWGGRNLEKLGKNLPEGKVAESWEVSVHPDGICTVSNGIFRGLSLKELIDRYPKEILGSDICKRYKMDLPLLFKLIDANDRLSVQVHPDDKQAQVLENKSFGKHEAWYIIDAKPGARIIYGLAKGTCMESFLKAVSENRIGSCLNYMAVSPGDVIDVYPGMVHAICEGIILAEIQQNSNLTYRIYDYDRLDSKGRKRELHIDKAIEVIDFCANCEASSSNCESYSANCKGSGTNCEGTDTSCEGSGSGYVGLKAVGIKVPIFPGSAKTYRLANRHFSLEELDVTGRLEEKAEGDKFFIYFILEGEGQMEFLEEYPEGETGYCGGKTVDCSGKTTVKKGETVLVPASLGSYSIRGNFKALKMYVPDLQRDVIMPLTRTGHSIDEIREKVCRHDI